MYAIQLKLHLLFVQKTIETPFIHSKQIELKMLTLSSAQDKTKRRFYTARHPYNMRRLEKPTMLQNEDDITINLSIFSVVYADSLSPTHAQLVN